MSQAGIRVVYGLLGDGNLAVVDDLANRFGVRFIPVNREDIAVSAADAHVRLTGDVAVASVTHGPGLTNTLTALHEAARAGTPMLLLTGDTDPEDLAHNQRIDQPATVGPTGAGYVRVASASTITADFSRAVRQAALQRRPVVLDLPAPFLSQQVEYEWHPPGIHEAPSLSPDPDSLDRALGVIASSSRPIILAGRGCVEADARDEAESLAGVLNAPVATTLGARGLFRGHPFALGVMGTVGSTLSAEIVAEADCLVALGAGLNRYTTAYGSLLQGKSVVQVDADRAALGRWCDVDAGIVGDARIVAGQMTEMLSRLDEVPPGLVSEDLRGRLAAYDPSAEFEDRSDDDRIDSRTLMIWLDRVMPADRVVVCDVGGFMETPLRYLEVVDPRAQVLPARFGAVGLGMGAAIGAGVADPRRPTLLVTGDGGWMMGGINGLDSAVREGLDLVVLVLNDGGYGIERRALEARGSPSEIASMPWPDPNEVAVALGGESLVVRSRADLEQAREAIENRARPLVLDARVF